MAERFSLLTLITLGEVVAATSAVGALVQAQGWSVAAVLIAASGLVLAAALWWAYFLVPSRTILEQWPERTWAWRYAHLPMFGAIAVPLAVPVGAVILPLAAAIVVGLVAGGTTALAAVIALVALGSIVEVAGHEWVGYRHTIRAVERRS